MINQNKPILVIGGSGRTGQCLTYLLKRGMYKYYAPTKLEMNVLQPNSIEPILSLYDIEYVINLFGITTTIRLNHDFPADIFTQTIIGNTNIIKACNTCGVEKLINIVSSCAYPSDKPFLKESEFWTGEVHESVRPHALAKRGMYALSQFYRQQYGLNVICLAFNGLYGSVRNWNNPDSLKACDSLIKKIVDARLSGSPTVVLYGTGKPRREWLYTQNAAESIIRALELYNDEEILNVGTGIDYTIKELAEIIAQHANYKGEIIFDPSYEDGQPKKLFDVSKQKEILKWYPWADISYGVSETIRDYETYLKGKS